MCDVNTLLEISNIEVLQISKVIHYLEKKRLAALIPCAYRDWALSCDEHVILGKNVQRGVIDIIPWETLRDMPIVRDPFCATCNLQDYEVRKRAEREELNNSEVMGYERVCNMVLASAKTMARTRLGDDLFVTHIVQLITKPGIAFWGMLNEEAKGEVVIWAEERWRM